MSILRERFEAKVDRPDGPDVCHLWTGGISTPGGYGSIGEEVEPGRWRIRRAHRVAWELYVGPIGAMSVLHHCDNPACVRADPDPMISHLFLGTQAQNVADMMKKHRGVSRPGQESGRAKLTWEHARAIRLRHEAGETQIALAREFGLSQPTISALLRGESWREPGVVTRDFRTKISKDQRSEIKKRIAEGSRQVDLAREYGVGQSRISAIVHDYDHRRRGVGGTG